MKKHSIICMLLVGVMPLLMGANGDPNSLINQEPWSVAQPPVLLQKPTGIMVKYWASADTKEARGDSLLEAQVDAAAGDIIFLRADAEISDPLGKDGVSYDVAPGVTVKSLTTTYCITDGGSKMSFSIRGGKWETTDAQCVYLHGNETTVTIDAESLASDGSSNACVEVEDGATLNVRVQTDISSDEYDGIWVDDDGKVFFQADTISGGDNGVEIFNIGPDPGDTVLAGSARVIRGGTNLSGEAVYIAHGTVRIVAQELFAGNTTSLTAIRSQGEADAIVDAEICHGTVKISHGKLTIENMTITDCASTAPAVSYGVVFGGGICDLIAKNVRFDAGASSPYFARRLGTSTADCTLTLFGTLMSSPADFDPNTTLIQIAEISSASTSTEGQVELATAAEITSGTNDTNAVTPDALAGSDFGKRVISIPLTDPQGSELSVVDGIGGIQYRVPAVLDGYDLVDVAASVTTASSSGDPEFHIYNLTKSQNMLSTALTIDANDDDSKDATTDAEVDSTKDDVSTGDKLRFDCDVAGTGAKGLTIELTFQLP